MNIPGGKSINWLGIAPITQKHITQEHYHDGSINNSGSGTVTINSGKGSGVVSNSHNINGDASRKTIKKEPVYGDRSLKRYANDNNERYYYDERYNNMSTDTCTGSVDDDVQFVKVVSSLDESENPATKRQALATHHSMTKVAVRNSYTKEEKEKILDAYEEARDEYKAAGEKCFKMKALEQVHALGYNKVSGASINEWTELRKLGQLGKRRGRKGTDEFVMELVKNRLWKNIVVSIDKESGTDTEKIEKIISIVYSYSIIVEAAKEARACYQSCYCC
jgi:hypothetical protein